MMRDIINIVSIDPKLAMSYCALPLYRRFDRLPWWSSVLRTLARLGKCTVTLLMTANPPSRSSLKDPWPKWMMLSVILATLTLNPQLRARWASGNLLHVLF